MFRRPLRRAMRRAARPDVPPLLRRAHEFMAAGNYAAAAEAFETLARAGEARQHPKTGQMYLQAGRARILAGQKSAGFQHLKAGLDALQRMGLRGQLFHAGQRVTAELNQHGMTAEAQELSQWLQTNIPAGMTPAPVPSPAKRPILPTHCPGCGGPLRADDVEWLDEVTAECAWCGSPLRDE
ncbi:MAG: hypothetical protein HFACDABA_00321 [Anaerolineales bacterium]|nr:hypothetical protein [Anaerolineales bacterium]